MKVGAVILIMAACAAPQRPVSQRDDGVAIEANLAAAFAVAPAHPVARRYNEPYLDAPDPQYAALATALRGRRDVRLDFVADDLARVAARGGLVDDSVAAFFTRSYGVIEPVDQIAITRATTPESQIAELRTALGPALGYRNVRLGFGTANGALFAILVYDLRVELDPFPRVLVGSADLSGALQPGIDRLEIERWPAQASQPMDLAGGAFRASVACSESGTSWISLEAIDADGPAHLVQFPVTCGSSPVPSYLVEPAANFQAGSLERHVAAVINRERGARALPPLELLPVVERSAQALARDKSNRVPVVEPPGLASSITSHWTAFHGDSIEAAVEHLLNEPREVKALTTRESNRFGVGVQKDAAGGYWVAIVYAHIPHPIDVVEARRWLAFEVKGRSRRRSEESTSWNLLADAFARRLARGDSHESVEALFQRYASSGPGMVIVSDTLADIRKLDPDRYVRGRRIFEYGVGVAQDATSGLIQVVVIYSDRSGIRPCTVTDPC